MKQKQIFKFYGDILKYFNLFSQSKDVGKKISEVQKRKKHFIKNGIIPFDYRNKNFFKHSMILKKNK